MQAKKPEMKVTLEVKGIDLGNAQNRYDTGKYLKKYFPNMKSINKSTKSNLARQIIADALHRLIWTNREILQKISKMVYKDHIIKSYRFRVRSYSLFLDEQDSVEEFKISKESIPLYAGIFDLEYIFRCYLAHKNKLNKENLELIKLLFLISQLVPSYLTVDPDSCTLNTISLADSRYLHCNQYFLLIFTAKIPSSFNNDYVILEIDPDPNPTAIDKLKEEIKDEASKHSIQNST